MSDYKLLTAEDGVVRAMAWTQNAPREMASTIQVPVLYNRVKHSVSVLDWPYRPPHPDGVWLDDLVAAACRIRFSCSRGTCRPVQGEEGLLEFREVWPDPTRSKIHEDIAVEIHAKPPHCDVIRVRTSAYPGADVTSVIHASAYQALERRYGAGELVVPTGKDHKLEFTPNPHASVHRLVPCRYSIQRDGGRLTEVVIYIPAAATRSWTDIVASITKECRLRLGPGSLKYLPELGECSFSWV